MENGHKVERFSLVWQECQGDSDIARRFYVPGFQGYLPFFIWGDELVALERKEAVELREEHLLKGILYGLHGFEDESRYWPRDRQAKDTLLHLLGTLERGFGYKSLEKLILDVAADLGKTNGSSASFAVLETGRDLLPQSSRIKSDLILNLWALLNGGADREPLLQEILDLVPQIKLDEIFPDAKEVICYYGFCAIVLLGKQERIEPYLEEFIYPHVTYHSLKQKIKDLLENPKAFTPADLTIAGQ